MSTNSTATTMQVAESLAECNKVAATNGLTYSEYLQLDRLLSCQKLLSYEAKNPVESEHLFLIIHQTYELWFKQIIFDLDSVLALFKDERFVLEEKRTLKILNKLDRMTKIMKILVEQIMILETMSALEFNEMRRYIDTASGFQSLQFRLLENKWGVKPENRVSYNKQHYKEVFKNDASAKEILTKTEEREESLAGLVEKWLERTVDLGGNGNHFWKEYVTNVNQYLADIKKMAEDRDTESERDIALTEYIKLKDSFDTILNPEVHAQLVLGGDRRFNHKATQGALMIYFYQEMPRFSQPFILMAQLKDIDSLFTKWRYNHVNLVHRMIGSKSGTGGSSGYMYLRSTCGDRYKVFLDLFNLPTYMIPQAYVPKLTNQMKCILSYNELAWCNECDSTEEED